MFTIRFRMNEKNTFLIITLSILLFQIFSPIIPVLAAYPDTEADFEEYLSNIGTPLYNEQFKKANFNTYKTYEQIVYGEQHGRWKNDSMCPKGGSEYEYLGYDYYGVAVTNYCFPNDETGGNVPEDWNFIAVDPDFSSWELDPAQYEQLYYSRLQGHGATTLTMASIGGRAFGEVQTAPTWKSEGSIRTENRGANGKIYYATFTVPPIADGVLLEGTLDTNSNTYTIPADKTSVNVNYTVRAKAAGTGKYFRFDQVKSLKAAFNPKGNNHLALSDYNNELGAQYSLKSGTFYLSRDEYGVGTHTINLEGYTTIESKWGDKDVREPKKTITLVVEPPADQFAETTLEIIPGSIEYKGNNVQVDARITGKLFGVSSASQVQRWIFSVREKENTEPQTELKDISALSSSTIFTFTIPKSKITNGFVTKGAVKEYLQTYVGRAKALLKNGVTVDSTAVEASTLIWEGDEEPSTPPPGNGGGEGNINAVITGPTQVEEDSSFQLDGNQSTSTGTIVEWTWYEIRNGQREPLDTDFKKNWYRGAKTPVLEMYDNNFGGGASPTYELEIRDSNGRTDTARHTVNITDYIDPGVRAALAFELEAMPEKIKITRAQYEADEKMTFSTWVSAQNTQVMRSSARTPLWFFADVNRSDIEGIKPQGHEQQLSHPNFQKYVRAPIENGRLAWEESTVRLDFTFRPKSDPYLRAGVVVRHPSNDIWDVAVATLKLPLDIPPDFDLVIRPDESHVYAGSEDGEHFIVYQDWTNQTRLDPMNEEDGLVVTSSNPSVAKMEKMKFTDSNGEEYTSYYMRGLTEGQTTITATFNDAEYKNKKVAATLNVYKLDLDIEPKNQERYVMTEYFIPSFKVLNTNPDEYPAPLSIDDPNLKITFDPADAVEEIVPGVYRGVQDKVVKVTATYNGSKAHGVPLSTSTNVIFKPHRPVAEISMPSQVYMDEPFTVTGASSYSNNGGIVNYKWEISDPVKSIEGVSKEMSFNKEGEYEFTLTVTDKLGYTDTTTKTIKVLPNYPTAHFTTSGTLKENRKVTFDAGTSIGSKWGNFAVDHTLTKWEITPVGFQSSSSIHILQNTNKQIINVMFNEKGKYKVRVKVTNEKGASSSWYEEIITIGPDVAPITEFTHSSPNFRNPENSNIATVTLEDQSYSQDSDSIGDREWFYRYNPNKDGDFSDLHWLEIPNSNGKDKVTFDVKDVGQYQIKTVVTETFGQPTIDEFYDPSLRRKAEKEKTILIDNKAPEVSFTDIGLRQKTQVVLMIDEDYPLTNEQIEQHLNQTLNQKNIDVILNRINGSAFKYVEVQPKEQYDDGLYRGTLERYLYSGEYIPPHTKYVTDSRQFNDASESYRNTLQSRFYSGYYNIAYNKDGYVGTLTGTNFQPVFSHSNSGTRNGTSWSSSWTYFSDSKSSLNGSPPSPSGNQYTWVYENYPNYYDVQIIDQVWTGDIEGPGEYKCCSHNDWSQTYSYSRGFIFEYSYKEDYNDRYYDVTMTFGGNVTKPAQDTRVYRYKGTVEKNIFTRLLDETDWDKNVDRNVIYLSNNSHPDFNKGTENYTDMVNELAYQGINFYGIGTEVNQIQLNDVLNGTGVEGQVFTTSSESEVNSALETIADTISLRMSKEPTTSITVVLDEEFFPKTEYTDFESDSMIEEKFKFSHSPNYYENPMGLNEQHEQWLTGLPNSFSLIGKYVLNYQAKDDPVPGKDDNSGFQVYRKWSNLANAVVYVHRRPVADFNAYFIDEENGNFDFQIIDRSYDLDGYSQGEDGIKNKKWRYREVNGTWQNKEGYSQPTLADFALDGEYEIELTVEDFQDAFDVHREIVSIVTEPPNAPPVAGFVHDPTFTIGEQASLTSTAYDQNGDTLDIYYEIHRPSGDIITIPVDTHTPMIVSGSYIYFQVGDSNNFVKTFVAPEPGVYRITQYVDDGEYTDIATSTLEVNDLEITGYVKHTENWKRIHENLGCVEDPCPKFYSGEKFLFDVAISDYPVLTIDAVEQVVVRVKGERDDGQPVSVGYGLSGDGGLNPDPLILYRKGLTAFDGEWYETWMTETTTQFKKESIVEFLFEVTYKSDIQDVPVTRTDKSEVLIIGNAYEAFPFHQSY